MLTVVGALKNTRKSADSNRWFWVGSANVKRTMLIIFIFVFGFMFAVLFLSGTKYVSVFVPARKVYIRTPSLLPSQFWLVSSVLLFSQQARPSTSQNLPSFSSHTHTLTHFIIVIIITNYFSIIFFPHGATAPSGPGPPHCRGFTITLKTHHIR
jgi:hypothetical protein